MFFPFDCVFPRRREPRVFAELGSRLRGSTANDYAPFGPREIATMPVRATSTRPTSRIRLTKVSSLSLPPVTSNTKLSIVASITRARYTPARERKSVVQGQSVSVRVDPGGGRVIKTKKKKHK